MDWKQRDRRTALTAAAIVLWPVLCLGFALAVGGSTAAWTGLAVAVAPVMLGVALLWFVAVNRMELEHFGVLVVFAVPSIAIAFGVWAAVIFLGTSALMKVAGLLIAQRRRPLPFLR